MPQSPARREPGGQVWMVLPQVNRQVAVRWLVVLAARQLDQAVRFGPARTAEGPER